MPTISIEEAKKRGYSNKTIQTILFPKDSFTRKSSTKWLKEHGYPAKYYRTTKGFIRRMIHNPVEYATYYSKKLPNGVIIVFQTIDTDGGAIFTNAMKQFNQMTLKKPSSLPTPSQILQQSPTGNGLFSDTFQKTKQGLSLFYNKVIPKRQAGLLPPRSRQLLEQIKDEPIQSLIIVRTPIEKYINVALNFLSLGQWNNVIKSLGYDKLFHLSLFINKKYIFHKIEVPTLARDNPIKQNSEIMTINFNPVSIGEFVNNTRNIMGDTLFSNYNPVNNNCQNFIASALKGNNSLTKQAFDFIYQDSKEIFKRLPQYVENVATTITDIGARVDRVIQGEGAYNLLTKVKSKMTKLKIPYTDVQLSDKPTKKIMVIIDGRKIHFGAKNSNTFIEGANKQKRDAFKARHSKVLLKDGSRAIDLKYSPAWFSYYVLWS